VPRIAQIVLFLLTWSLLQGALPVSAAALLQPAAPAPRFALNNLHGGLVEVKNLHGKRLLVLYFFDIESRPSLECLGAVDSLARRHPEELTVYGISSSPPELIKRYVAEHGITIELLHDTNRVRELYGARQVLPVGCIIGQDFKVLEYYQGGGAGFNAAILGRIKRELQGKEQLAARPAAHEPKPARTVKKRQGKGTAAEPAAQASGVVAPTPEEKVQPNKLGKIIDESQW
jgi:peroxiredoxin